MERRPRPCVSLLLLVVLILAGGRLRADEPQKPGESDFELYQLFADTLDQIQRNYVKDVSRRELMEAAIEGVLEKLDPYSNYISPEDINRFKSNVEHQFGGIGIQMGMEDGQLKVISPLLGTPAYRAGLGVGRRDSGNRRQEHRGHPDRRGRQAAQGRSGHEGDAQNPPHRRRGR